MERENIVTLASLTKQRKIQAKTQQILTQYGTGDDCSFDINLESQQVFHCKTCNQNPAGSGICLSCYINCHIDHDTVSIGLKSNFQCDCGTPRMSSKCILKPKQFVNFQNIYNHNFLGKFCVCDNQDSQERDSIMVMCSGCNDWFHESCIKLSNNSHNFAQKQFHLENIPSVPTEQLESYFFICQNCLKQHLYIPSAYRNCIYFEQVEQSKEKTGCPMEGCQIFEKFPYHIFLSLKFLIEKCVCLKCKEQNISFLRMEGPSILDKIQEEAEKIMEEEDEEEEVCEQEIIQEFSNMTHQSQIVIAEGYSIIQETIGDYLMSHSDQVIDLSHVEAIKRKMNEKLEAYKKQKLDKEDHGFL